jgi:hypothetical protein
MGSTTVCNALGEAMFEMFGLSILYWNEAANSHPECCGLSSWQAAAQQFIALELASGTRKSQNSL